MPTLNNLPAWLSGHQAAAGGIAAAALIALIVAARTVRALARRLRWRLDFADTLTVLVALFATLYAATGQNKYLHDAMGYGPDLRAALLVVYEGAVVVSGIRARKNIRDTGSAGVDGVAMWILTVLSGTLSASVSGSVREAAGRLVVPAVGAWLWERAMAPERRVSKARRASGPVRWRITPERVFVWLRLADATDTDVSAVDAGRRVARFLRKTDRETNGRRWPFTAKARADRERLRMFRDALMRFGDPAEVYGKLAQAGYTETLNRLGITDTTDSPRPDAGPSQTPESAVSQAAESGVSQTAESGVSQASQAPSLLTPGDSDFAEVIASLPPSRVSAANGRRKVAAAAPARRQAAVSARVGVDRDSAASVYRDSVEAGAALSSRDLAQRAGVSQSTASRVIREARQAAQD